MNKKRLSGHTLIELVMSIAIISFSLVGLFVAINTSMHLSSDPLIMLQGISIAESYLEEIIAKDFPSSPCPFGTRETFTNICQYNGLTQVPTDQTNTAIAGLQSYTVNINVDSSTASLGSPSLTSPTQVVRIDITVAHANMQSMTFSVYRTNY